MGLYVLVVGLGQLVGHGEDGQRSVLLRPKRLRDAAAVDQPSLPALYEHSAQHLLVILTVHVEGLRDKRKKLKPKISACLDVHLGLLHTFLFYLFIFLVLINYCCT